MQLIDGFCLTDKDRLCTCRHTLFLVINFFAMLLDLAWQSFFFSHARARGASGAGLTFVPCISAIATLFYGWGYEHGRIRGLEPVFLSSPFFWVDLGISGLSAGLCFCAHEMSGCIQ